MSNPYNNGQPWGQQQNTFNQPPQNPQEFDFSGSSDEIQRQSQQTPYTYHPSQLQLPSNGGAPSMIRSNFSVSQPRTERRTASFGMNSAVPRAPDAFPPGTYGSSPNQNQTVESYNSMFSNSPTEQLSWTTPSAFGYQKPIPTSNGFNGSGYDGTPEGTYITPNLSTSPSAMQDAFPAQLQPTSHPQSSHYSLAPTLTTSDPRSKRARSQAHDDSKDEEQDEMASDAKDSAKAKS